VTRNFWLDFLKFMLAIFVVGIHTVVLKGKFPYLSHILVEGIFRIAVPIFFIINGYYFYSSVKNLNSLKNWLQRVLVLYAFWMLFYLPYYFPNSSSFLDLKYFFLNIIVGFRQLWYVSAMLGAGIITYYYRQKSVKFLCFLAGVLFAVGTIIQYIIYYKNSYTPIYTYRNFLFFGAPMMMIGVIIKKAEPIIFSKNTTILILLIGLALLWAESHFSYMHPGNRGFDMYASLIIICPSIFLLAKNSGQLYGGKFLPTSSSVIYFSHYIFIIIADRYFLIGAGTKLFVFCIIPCLVLCSIVSFFPNKFKAIL
jgi:Acyltransferase family